jgi:multisubunit Na+/H+ antiporter MnhB subunit
LSVLSWALDASVAILLVSLVVRAMLTRDLFEAVVLFIAFGLALSLAWIRLGAPDVALAEAALGAGVTGALFLSAFQRLDRASKEEGRAGTFVIDSGPGRVRIVFLGVAAALAAGVVGLVMGLPAREAVLAQTVDANLSRTGVSNPVTGVLLSFRAYDTLFEVAVLVVAMVAVWSLDRGSRRFARDPEELAEDPVLDALVRLVTPVAGVTAVYLVWSGSYAAGGAFQGASLLAGIGVLLAASGLMRPITSASPAIRVLGVMGLALFTGLGLALMPWTGAVLAYPEGWAYGITLLVEGALTLSIAVVLLELFIDVPSAPEADPRLERVDPTGDPLGRTITLDGAWIRGADEDP